jgi:mono/diheme cytochrome c family protein
MKFLTGFLLGGLALPALGLAFGFRGALPIAATSFPPEWESRLVGRAVTASLAREAEWLKNPLEVTDETLLAGLKRYRTGCAGCHGDLGHPSHWGARNFYPPAPQFAERPPALTAPQIFLAVKHGIRYSGMGGWDGEMPDEDIWRVASFLARLDSMPPRVADAWKTGAPK